MNCHNDLLPPDFCDKKYNEIHWSKCPTPPLNMKNITFDLKSCTNPGNWIIPSDKLMNFCIFKIWYFVFCGYDRIKWNEAFIHKDFFQMVTLSSQKLLPLDYNQNYVTKRNCRMYTFRYLYKVVNGKVRSS